LGAFVKRFGDIVVDKTLAGNIPNLMYMEWDNDSYEGVDFDPGGIRLAFVGRYSITENQIEELEKYILESEHDSIIVHPVFLALLKDY
jgi:hypothetical protein